MENRQITLFFDKLNNLIRSKTLIKLVLSNQRDHTSDLKSIIISIVALKKGERLNFVFRYKTKDITKNHDIEEALALIKKSLETDFFNADVFSNEETFRLLITSHGKVKIRSNAPAIKAGAGFSHDRMKDRILATQNNIYLRELGILNSGFEVRHDMSDKFLQINKYIELLGPFIRDLDLPEGFHVTDMGSGKGYLTFALYDYLTNILGKKPVMTGVESKKELVNLSNDVASKAGFAGLKFINGTIRTVELDHIDILIALHACDTATDDAIYRGITSGASLIVCAPCCHKQIRKEFHVTNELKSVTKHGILEERQAEIITDGLRALIMEEYGYKTKVFEFISTDHTPKNVMIVGRKISEKPAGREKIMKNIQALKEFYGIKQHYLEKLFINSIG
jgi:hypothetical protein